MAKILGDKGVIVKSALSENIKVTLGLWGDPELQVSKPYTLLAKPTARRHTRGGIKTTDIYKTWLSLKEVYALRSALDRAVILMEEYFEGTLDLEDILKEDEDALRFITESPTIKNMFDHGNVPKTDEEIEERRKKDDNF